MTLWRTKDCADYLRMTPRSFRARVKPLPSFPPAQYLPTVDGISHPYWHAEDVRAWAEKHLRAGRFNREGVEA